MLHGSYIELLAVVDPNAKSATLARWLACYAGVHLLAFAIEDEQIASARLQRAAGAKEIIAMLPVLSAAMASIGGSSRPQALTAGLMSSKSTSSAR